MASAALILPVIIMWGCSDSADDEASAQRDVAASATTTGIDVSSVAALEGPPRLGEDDLAGLDESARESIEQAVAAVEDDPSGQHWLELGQAYHAYRQFDLARQAYIESARREDTAQSRYLLSLVLMELGQADAAVAEAVHAVQLDPRYFAGHNQLGLWLLDAGKLTGAEAAFVKARAIRPHDPAAAVGLARVRLQQQKFDEAIELLSAHIARMPNDDNARYLLGVAHQRAGHEDEAAAIFAATSGGPPIVEDPWLRDVLLLRRGFRTDFNRANQLLEAGRYDQSIALFEALHERDPQEVLIHVNLHRAYRQDGQLDRSIDLLHEAQEIRPLFDMVHIHLAGAYLQKASVRPADRADWLDKAMHHAEQALELSPTYGVAHGLKGDICFARGEPEQAADAYETALRLDPGNVLWLQKAAQMRSQLGEFDRAVPLLEQLNQRQPDNGLVLYLLGVSYGNAGRLDDAIRTLEHAQVVDPDKPAITKALDAVRARKAE